MENTKKKNSFATQFMVNEGGEVRLITAIESGKPAWYFVQLYAETYSAYKKAFNQLSMNIKDYGNILKSGWGEMPPQPILSDMKKRYEVKC